MKFSLYMFIFILFLSPSLLKAEITTDGSLGPEVSFSGPDYLIDAALGRQMGNNLFHSFGRFNIFTGEKAAFTGPDTIKNIISRVTGGGASMIDGLLRSEISGADFYFINPAGIMFGPNARIDIGGSLYAGTADYIRLSDGGRFDATAHPLASTLTSAPPSAFGFMDDNPGPISIESKIEVKDGKTISVTGGNIEIKGGVLKSSSGEIVLKGVASAGESFIKEHEKDDFDKKADISLKNESVVYTSGDKGGSIYIKGNSFVMERSAAIAETFGDKGSGSIEILVDNDMAIDNESPVSTATSGTSKSGDIKIKAKNISIQSGAYIDSSSYGPGNGGLISVKADNKLHIAGSGETDNSAILAESQKTGNGGRIELSALKLVVEDDAKISADVFSKGNGGEIKIHGGSASFLNGGTITAGTKGPGNGAGIFVDIDDRLEISGISQTRFSGIFANSVGTSGDTGRIDINAGSLAMNFGGTIQSGTAANGLSSDIFIRTGNLSILNGAFISTNCFGDGNSGSINLDVKGPFYISGMSSVANSGIYANSIGGKGTGGKIKIFGEDLVLDNGALIQTDAAAGGDSGGLDLNIKNLFIKNGAKITADTGDTGHGGDINIFAEDKIEISGMDETDSSGVFANSYGNGDGGNIFITANSISFIEDGTLQSVARSSGNSGNIEIEAGRIDFDTGGFISTETFGSGNGGSIRLDAKNSVKINGISQNHISGLHANSHNGGGEGGDIFIKTSLLDMANSGTIQSGTLFNGNTGTITLEVENFFLKTGANIITDTYGDGSGGDIRIFANESINITGFDPLVSNYSGIFANAKGGSGNGGNIFISGSALVMDDMAQIQAQTGSSGDAGNIDIDVDSLSLDKTSSIVVDTYSLGKSGHININVAGKADISNLSLISASSQPSGGEGGNIKISAKDIVLDSQGIIKAETYGKGDGGNIEIETERLQITRAGQVRSSTYAEGNSGDIFINATDRVIVSGTNGTSPSAIFSNAVKSSGASGNIRLVTQDLFVDYVAMIQAATNGDGDAGTIDLILDNLFMDNYSQISAGTYEAKGDGGDIMINSSGLISLTNGSSLSVNTWKQGKGGNIFISASDIDLSLESKIEASTKGEGNGGEVFLTADNLTIKDGARLSTDTLSYGRGGNIFIDVTGKIKITGTENHTFTGISSSSGQNGGLGGNMDISASSILVENLAIIAGVTLGESRAGQININTGNISFLNGGKIMTDSIGAGKGGDLSIYAKDSIKISGRVEQNFTGISTTTHKTGGDGGSINLDAPLIELDDGGSVFASTLGPGNAGTIGFNTKNLTLTDGAIVSTDSFGTGKGGDITANFSDYLKISGRKSGYVTGISSNTHTKGGNGGNVIIRGGDVIMENSGYISALTTGEGNAGFISFDVNTMNFNSSLVSTSSEKSGKGGNLSFMADKIFLNTASITAQSFGTGDAGFINMDISDFIKINNAKITTEAKNGGGGRMAIKSGNLLYLADSEITTSVQSGAGNGGDITIDPAFVILDHSKIIANAFEGNGGNISIISDYFITDKHSRVEASSELGIDGEINISAPDIEISGSIAVLPENFLDATRLLKNQCDVGNYETSSSLIVTGFGGTQTEPDDLIFITPR